LAGGKGAAAWEAALHDAIATMARGGGGASNSGGMAVAAAAPPPPRRRASRWDAPPPGAGAPAPPPPLPPPAPPTPDPFAFPPGLIPVLIRDAAAAGAPPYTPLAAAAIAGTAMPVPPPDGGRGDPALAPRLDAFFAEVQAYTPGLSRAQVEAAARAAAVAAAGGEGSRPAGPPGLASLAGGRGGDDPNTTADGRFIGRRGVGRPGGGGGGEGGGGGGGPAAGLGYSHPAGGGGGGGGSGGGGGGGRHGRRRGGQDDKTVADPYAAYRATKARSHRVDVAREVAARRAAERRRE